MKKTALLFIIIFACTCIYAQKKDDTKGNAGNAARTNADTKYTEGASGVKRSISYKFNTSLSNEDPGNGVFRYNAGTISKVSYIYLDNNDLSGDDQTKWYRTWDDTTGATARGQLNIVEKDGRNVNVFYITGVFSAEEGFWKIPVEYVSGAMPADGSVYFYVFNRIARKDKEPVTQQKMEEQVNPEEIVAVAEVIKEEVKPVVEQVVVEQKKEEVIKPVEKVEEVIP
ncbi:MAG TPA: hypothetical protein VHO68_01665, partial [Bacteroidales bacterium]|nr:hypothetical protein [Bacteroidales bacterium]